MLIFLQAIYKQIRCPIMKAMKLFLPLLVVSILSVSVTGCIFDPFYDGGGYGHHHHHHWD